MTDTGPLFVSSGDLVSDRRYKAAVELAARGDSTAWFALGAIRDRLGDRDGAMAAFRAASHDDPEDYHGARLQLARLGTGAGTPAMTEPYVRRLFDQYAGRYDAALTEHLHYRGPALLLEAVTSALARQARPIRFESLLDLGCGTGLGGAVFRPFSVRLVGVDLSAALIARAEAKGDYDRLVVGNLAAFLSDEIAKAAQYDLVLAADVFVYVNDLAPVLRRYRPRAGAARRGRLHGRDPFRRRRQAVADAALRPWQALFARCHIRCGPEACYAGRGGDPNRKRRTGKRTGAHRGSAHQPQDVAPDQVGS